MATCRTSDPGRPVLTKRSVSQTVNFISCLSIPSCSPEDNMFCSLIRFLWLRQRLFIACLIEPRKPARVCCLFSASEEFPMVSRSKLHKGRFRVPVPCGAYQTWISANLSLFLDLERRSRQSPGLQEPRVLS